MVQRDEIRDGNHARHIGGRDLKMEPVDQIGFDDIRPPPHGPTPPGGEWLPAKATGLKQ
jgi:hypothetical protein